LFRVLLLTQCHIGTFSRIGSQKFEYFKITQDGGRMSYWQEAQLPQSDYATCYVSKFMLCFM